MHLEVQQFVNKVKIDYPQFFDKKKILEVGSLNVNGSVRVMFKDCNYIGIDVGKGGGVDIVCPIHEYIHPEEFDTVISTEMLEHDKYWEQSLKQMWNNLKKGGILIFTCAGPNRPEHGTIMFSSNDAPFTTDYYRNISIEDFSSILPPHLFNTYYISYSREKADLYFYGIKI